MSWKGLLLMLFLVAGLLVLNSQRQEAERQKLSAVDQEYILFPDFQPALVSELRIDNLERAYQIKFERDAQANWFLTDPVPYPATNAIVNSLLSAMQNGLAQRVASEDLGALGLDPPKVVLEIEQIIDGQRQQLRLDLGDPGLNKDRIYARAVHRGSEEGEVLSVTRAIYNLLVRFPNDFRETSAIPYLNPANVISFKRRGSFWNSELQREEQLDFDMQRDGANWQRCDAPQMSLSPQIAGFLVSSAAQLRVEVFEQDLPAELGRFGLAEPSFSVELTSGDGAPVTLAFGHPAARSGVEISSWFFHRVGFPHVWSIDQGALLMLTIPTRDLYNPHLLLALRESITKLELRLGESLLLFERESQLSKQQWFLTQREPGQPERRFPADPGSVKDLLAKLEGAEISYFDGVEFDDEDSLGSISIHSEDGQVFGGRLGKRWKDAERGLVRYRFLRFGDELPGLLDESLAEFCQPGGIDPARLRPRSIHSIRWADARRIELSHAGKRFAYTHSSDDKRWTVDPGEERRPLEAPKVFTESVQSLLSLFAQEWMDDFDANSLQDRLGVSIFDNTAKQLSFELGRDPAGRLVYVQGSTAATLNEAILRDFEASHSADLLQGLIELFRED